MAGLRHMQEEVNPPRISRNLIHLEKPLLKELEDVLAPAEACQRLHLEKESCFLFERASGNGSNTSYLMFSPIVTFRIRPEGLLVERDGFCETVLGNPVRELQRILEKSLVDAGKEVPLFSCGVVGYLGYDCIRYLENISLPEIASGEDEACLVLFRHILVANHETKKTLLVSHRLPTDDRTEIAKAQFEITKQLSTSCPNEIEEAFYSRPELSETVTLSPLETQSDFTASVSKIREHISVGDIFQCVISKRFMGKGRPSSLNVYEKLRKTNASPYHFHFSGGGQTLVGASPEMLVKVSGKTISTCPIAGTRPRGADAESDKRRERQLLESTKETSEHVMLVDLSRNDIGKVSRPGTVRVTEFMKVHRFSHVMHLVSVVEGDLCETYSPLDALFSCFPAGTLTGTPKIRAMQIISQLEKKRRGAYGGAVVLYDFRGELDSCINIRSMLSHGEECYVQAGAGIVFDSRPAREEEEIENKSMATRRAIEGSVDATSHR